MAAKKKPETFTEDALGVPHFEGKSVGDAWHPDYHNPFEQMMAGKTLDQQTAVKDAAVKLHDDLVVCRNIALSVYGRLWAEHLVEVYDRFRALRDAEP